MRIRSILLPIIAILFSVVMVQSQEKTVYGLTTMFDSISISGATVEVQSSGEIVLSDSLGKFVVKCNPKKDKLKITANGFYTEKVKLTEKTRLVAVNLRLKPGEDNLEHAIGFGHVSEKDRIAAVASLDKDDVDFSLYSNMTDLIRARLAGVQVINNELVIRGRSTTTEGGDEVLILIDGRQANYNTLKMIHPMQVKNISVIKDASAAIYGARAANGVLIVETKR